MSMIRVAPEVHLVLDPLTSLLAEEREDLVNSLSPNAPLLASFPGREDTSHKAGFYGNAFYGIIIGLVFSGLLTVALYVVSLMSGVM